MGEEGRERIPSSSKQERALIKIRAEIIESREGAASFFLLRLRRGSDIRDREDEENNIFAAFAPKAASAERERERSSLLGALVHHRIKRLDGCDCERLPVGIRLKGYGKESLSHLYPHRFSVLFR